jgi:hypothetical protein
MPRPTMTLDVLPADRIEVTATMLRAQGPAAPACSA